MNTGSYQPPYPPACGGRTTRRTFLGPPFQHARESERAIPIWPNWTTISAAAPQRGDVGPPDSFVSGNGVARWPDRELDGNEYHSGNGTQSGNGTHDYRVCHKQGWKAVRARKAWQGMPGFTHCETDTCPRYTTRYRTRAFVLSTGLEVTQVGNETYTFEATADVARTITVDRYTGKWTADVCTGPVASGAVSGEGYTQYYTPFGNAMTWLAEFSTFGPPSPGHYNELGEWKPVCGKFVFPFLPNAILPDPNGHFSPFGGIETWDGLTPEEVLAAIEANHTATREVSGLPCFTDAGGVFVGTVSGTVTLTEATVQLTETLAQVKVVCDFVQAEGGFTPEPGYTGPTPEMAAHSWFEFSITLSNDYTLAACIADAVGLANTWSLSDDVQYPWRTDGYCGLVPLVVRDEQGPTLTSYTYCDCATVDDRVATGTIIGAPTPGGYGWNEAVGDGRPDGHFAFGIQNWITVGGVWVKDETQSHGDWTPVAYGLPRSATYWCGGLPGGDAWGPDGSFPLPDGAFVILQTDTVYVQKYAVIRENLPSQNWFGPCGARRDEIDQEDPVFCAHATAETPLYRWDGRDAAHPPAWPICGRVECMAFTAAGDSMRVTLSPAAPYLRVGDEVDLVTYDAAFAETLLATVTVTAVTADTFTYAGTAPDPATGVYAKSRNAPHFKWYFDLALGTVVFRQWTVDQCGEPPQMGCGETCIPFTPCNPAIAAWISENAPELFPAGSAVSHLPSTLAGGTNWQGAVETYMADLYSYQHPHRDCDTDEDPCASDPTRPGCAVVYVEPRCQVPEGAPALPDEIGVPCTGVCDPPAVGVCRRDAGAYVPASLLSGASRPSSVFLPNFDTHLWI